MYFSCFSALSRQNKLHSITQHPLAPAKDTPTMSTNNSNFMNVQWKIKENAEELSKYMADLKQWTAEIGQEDKAMSEISKQTPQRVRFTTLDSTCTNIVTLI